MQFFKVFIVLAVVCTSYANVDNNIKLLKMLTSNPQTGGIHKMLTNNPSATRQDISVDELFETAWGFKNRILEIEELQITIADMVKNSSVHALTTYESDIRYIIELEEPVRQQLNNAIGINSCIANLQNLLSSYTTFGGYGAANCVRAYDEQLEFEIIRTNDVVHLYNEIVLEMLMITMRSFSNENIFTHKMEIIDRFNTQFEKYITQLEFMAPQVQSLKERTFETIIGLNSDMDLCLSGIQTTLINSYDSLLQLLQFCLN